jgi:N-glycosylase/DNA lyase
MIKNHLEGDLRTLINRTIENNELMERVKIKEREFLSLKTSTLERKFSELVFCTLTANASAEMGLRCQEHLRNIDNYSMENLREKLIECKYRFRNTRAKYIEHNHKKMFLLNDFLEKENRRELLIENYMGIGMKEASHFLRNIGYFQYSILDKHIQRFLSNYYNENIRIKNKKDYYNVEKRFIMLSEEYNFPPGIMDLIIWYIMTGKIIK